MFQFCNVISYRDVQYIYLTIRLTPHTALFAEVDSLMDLAQFIKEP